MMVTVQRDTLWSKKSKILIPIYNGTYFASSLKLAQKIASVTDYEFIFLFGQDYPTRREHILTLSGKFEFYLVPSINQNNFAWLVIKKIKRNFKYLDQTVNFYILFRDWRLLKKLLTKIIEDDNIKLFVLPADNRYKYGQVVKIAHHNHRKVIIIPYWFAGERELIESIGHSSLYRPLRFESWIIKRVAPVYIKIIELDKDHSPMIPVSVSEILFNTLTRITPPNPWILHSGYSDKIIVESKKTFEFAIELGFAREQLVLCGSVYLDEMDEYRRLESKSISILIAVAPNMFNSREHRQLPFNNYEEYLVYLCSTVSGIDLPNIIFSMHPSDTGNYQFIFDKFNCQVSKEQIHLLLPSAELFIATISATVQWANYLQIPTINFDFYNYSYPDYLKYENVFLALTPEIFEEKLYSFLVMRTCSLENFSANRMIENFVPNSSFLKILHTLKSHLE
jgi:hypothetical protein